MKNQDKFISLFSNCILVKGAKRSLISDLQSGKYYKLPAEIPLEIFSALKKVPFKTIVVNFSPIFNNVEEFLLGLVDLDLAFFCDHPEKFPELNTSWTSPSKITNAILSFPFSSLPLENRALEVISKTYCKHLEIRCLNQTECLPSLFSFLTKLQASKIRSIELFINAECVVEDHYLREIEKMPRVWSITLHNSKENDRSNSKKITTVDTLISNSCCGIIGRQYFTNNIQSYTESQNFNSCLNRKIFISEEGGIRNCPSFSKDLMNILDLDIDNIQFSESITHKWKIKKDDIDVCKDCEYRHMCTDCRAFVTEPENATSKPLKCGYNPYTGEWGDWVHQKDINKLLTHYNMQMLNSASQLNI